MSSIFSKEMLKFFGNMYNKKIKTIEQIEKLLDEKISEDFRRETSCIFSYAG